MSALLTSANPHRIKASHRRRRKIASGRFVQRYYDAEIGRFISPDPVGPEEDFVNHFNRYNYAQNNPVRYTDPDGRIVETVWDAANVVMGVASAAANIASGNYGAAAIDVGGVIVDVAATALPGVPGGAGAAIKAVRVAENIAPTARGVASEARVLKDIGEVKNTEKVATSQGRSIPDFQNTKQVGEIKDTKRVSDTKQIKSQREHAQATGREHTVITGTNTKVSGTVEQRSTVIRRDDLGPKKKK